MPEFLLIFRKSSNGGADNRISRKLSASVFLEFLIVWQPTSEFLSYCYNGLKLTILRSLFPKYK